MNSGSLLWGVLALASGIFICAYGNVMFRFVLAVLGFMLGFSAVMWLGGGLQGGLLLVVAIVVGAIVAALLYSLVRPALYIAGGILGIVIVLAILGLVGLAGGNLGIVGWILVIAGAGVGGFLGRGWVQLRSCWRRPWPAPTWSCLVWPSCSARGSSRETRSRC